MLTSDIQNYIRLLGRTFPEIKSIWLLGSRANGEARQDSDWDFLVFGDANTFQKIKNAPELKRNDVDLLIVHNGEDFEEPWPVLTPERPGPKAGSLAGLWGWEWAEQTEAKATYRATKEDCDTRTLAAIRVWPGN